TCWTRRGGGGGGAGRGGGGGGGGRGPAGGPARAPGGGGPPRRSGARGGGALATMAQVPPRRVKGNDKEQLRKLEEELKGHVFGQEGAIERLASAIKVSRAGLRDPPKAVGSVPLTG